MNVIRIIQFYSWPIALSYIIGQSGIIYQGITVIIQLGIIDLIVSISVILPNNMDISITISIYSRMPAIATGSSQPRIIYYGLPLLCEAKFWYKQK
jgi:hypothetical protein